MILEPVFDAIGYFWWACIVFGILGVLYFGPSLIAWHRLCRGAWGIFTLNLILGWTMLVWVVCFIWACASPGRHEK